MKNNKSKHQHPPAEIGRPADFCQCRQRQKCRSMDEQDRRDRGHVTFRAVGRRRIGRDTRSPEQSAEAGKNPIDIQAILRF